MKVEKVDNVDKQHEISMRSCLWMAVRRRICGVYEQDLQVWRCLMKGSVVRSMVSRFGVNLG